jgi:hypothetical protein
VIISPVEIAADIIRTKTSDLSMAVGGVVIGPASDEQMQAGVAQIVPAGMPVLDKYGPIQWSRIQIRCLAPTAELADRIAQAIYADNHSRPRTLGYQASVDKNFLVHLFNITAGPSMHYDSPETWETLLFAEVMIGTAPLDPGP